MTDFEIRRSRRRTLSIEVKNGAVIVRVPLKTTDAAAASFYEAHRGWVEERLARDRQARETAGAAGILSDREIAALRAEAKRVISERVAYYAAKLGVTYGRITVRCQRTRWGSCSSRGDLSFNCLLMLAPPEVLDSVIVHELCHRKEMNHSARFYAAINRVMPDYRARHRWLRENGPILLARAGGKTE